MVAGARTGHRSEEAGRERALGKWKKRQQTSRSGRKAGIGRRTLKKEQEPSDLGIAGGRGGVYM